MLRSSWSDLRRHGRSYGSANGRKAAVGRREARVGVMERWSTHGRARNGRSTPGLAASALHTLVMLRIRVTRVKIVSAVWIMAVRVELRRHSGKLLARHGLRWISRTWSAHRWTCLSGWCSAGATGGLECSTGNVEARLGVVHDRGSMRLASRLVDTVRLSAGRRERLRVDASNHGETL